jgi:hypothetical protein
LATTAVEFGSTHLDPRWTFVVIFLDHRLCAQEETIIGDHSDGRAYVWTTISGEESMKVFFRISMS